MGINELLAEIEKAGILFYERTADSVTLRMDVNLVTTKPVVNGTITLADVPASAPAAPALLDTSTQWAGNTLPYKMCKCGHPWHNHVPDHGCLDGCPLDECGETR